MKEAAVEYWIWLQSVLGAGAQTDEVISYFQSPEEVYKAGAREWLLSGIFTPTRMEKMKNTPLSVADDIIRECKKQGYAVITPDNPLYPSRLRMTYDYPLVLYVAGDATVLDAPVSIGIVGARKPGEYGTVIAQQLSHQLAKAGTVIVSGGALGIDSEAHAGAMLADGKTIAYLGCGLSVNYLKENASLRRAVTRHGAVASEYPPFFPAGKATFPIRNRLISGTSLGVVVIEAGIKSGSLVTARCANDQGRHVFAVPGDIVRSSFDGANYLIKSGAKPVFNAEDVLNEFLHTHKEFLNMEKADAPLSTIPYVDYRNYKKRKQAASENGAKPEREKNAVEAVLPPQKRALTDEVSKEAEIVYSVLEAEPVHIDDIVRKTSLKMNDVLSSLTELELFGFVEAMSGKKYKVK